MRHVASALVLVLAVAVAARALAQEPTTAGFLFAYAPEDRESFEAGYRRHLDWHRSREDSLSWFGWDVLVGSRPGAFVDGVFGVPFAALDVRVDPRGDQADAAVNVAPYATPLSREIVALRPDLSSATRLEEGRPSPFVEVVWYAAKPGDFERLEGALSALRQRASAGTLLPYTVYEHVAGAESGFVMMTWRDRLASFDEHARSPDRALRRILGGARGAAGTRESGIRAARSEVWLHRPDLTYRGSAREGQ